MKSKRLLTVLLLSIMLLAFPAMANAQEMNDKIANQISYETSVVPISDKIITKYRTRNGKSQYRRWNESTQRWLDRYWIDLN